MRKYLDAFLRTSFVLLMSVLLMAPAVFGQESGEEGSSMNQYLLLGLAAVILIVYMRRRKKRKGVD
jgi:LPXTG-motif cell wall-anchored protein